MKDITIEEAVKDLRELVQEYKDASVEGADMQVDVSFREERCRNLEKVLDSYQKQKEKDLEYILNCFEKIHQKLLKDLINGNQKEKIKGLSEDL